MKPRLSVLALFLCCAAAARAAEPAVFGTPEAAVAALATAVRAGEAGKVEAVLGGAGAADIVSSGDAVEDKSARREFLKAYDARHRLLKADGGKTATLVIGPKDWPFPVRLARGDGGWAFDTEAGKKEILFRRIGRNELNAMQVARAFVDAQNEYADMALRQNGTAAYAQRLVSSPGQKDGLYWPARAGETQSPLGALAANAAAEGYNGNAAQKAPYHGYYYKILTKQGPHAPGGALDYVVGDKMIGGFGLVAWPAEYRNSGVMTFIVSHDGGIYQRDLGEDTARRAPALDAFDPGPDWRKTSP